MKEMETFVKAFGEGLRTLAQGVQAIADKLDSYLDSSGGDRDFEHEPASESDSQAARSEETVSSKKPVVNATATVYETISNAGKSITYDELVAATGFDRKKLSNILHRLKKQGKIKNVDKGVYAGK